MLLPPAKTNRARRHFLGLATSAGAKIAMVGGLASMIAGPASAKKGGNGKGKAKGHRCFLRGTMIATPVGEIAAENLKAGDLVRTACGRSMAIKWIGRQAFAVSRNREALPIRISRHALEDNRPHSDLYVSPHHALLIDGVLIRAKDLVNGTTIAAALPVGRDTIEYYHILLGSHEVVLAEGVPVETLLLEADNHEAFSNFAEFTRLFPDGTIPAMAPVAPIMHRRGRDHLKALLRLAVHPRAADDDPIEKIHVRLAKRPEVFAGSRAFRKSTGASLYRLFRALAPDYPLSQGTLPPARRSGFHRAQRSGSTTETKMLMRT